MLVVAPMPFVIFCLLYAIILTLILLHGECCLTMSSFFGGVAFTIPVRYERSTYEGDCSGAKLTFICNNSLFKHTYNFTYLHPSPPVLKLHGSVHYFHMTFDDSEIIRACLIIGVSAFGIHLYYCWHWGKLCILNVVLRIELEKKIISEKYSVQFHVKLCIYS